MIFDIYGGNGAAASANTGPRHNQAGRVQGRFSFTPGQTIKLTVGGGGQQATSAGSAGAGGNGFGKGGAGGSNTYGQVQSSGGGGGSAIERNGQLIAVAGGGGGSAKSRIYSQTSMPRFGWRSSSFEQLGGNTSGDSDGDQLESSWTKYSGGVINGADIYLPGRGIGASGATGGAQPVASVPFNSSRTVDGVLFTREDTARGSAGQNMTSTGGNGGNGGTASAIVGSSECDGVGGGGGGGYAGGSGGSGIVIKGKDSGAPSSNNGYGAGYAGGGGAGSSFIGTAVTGGVASGGSRGTNGDPSSQDGQILISFT